MKHTLKIVACLALGALLTGGTSAKAQVKHEVSVQSGVGLSTLNYDVSNGTRDGKIGTTTGLGYRLYVTENISIRTGVEVAFYRADASLNSISDAYSMTDSEGHSFEFRSTTSGYKEEQHSTFLTIPIMAQYDWAVLGAHKLYGSLGLRIGLPLSATYEASSANLKTSGYYPAWGLSIDDPRLGFGSYTMANREDDLNFKASFMLAGELGVKWNLGSLVEGLSVYTGCYLDYGLNDIRKDKNQAFLLYNTSNPKDYRTNSLLTAQYKETTTQEFTKKVTPFALGLKVGIAYTIPSKVK